MSHKACQCHHGCERRKLLKRILIGIASFIVLILFLILLIWIILRPQKPSFTLQDATIYAFNLSSTTTTTTTTEPSVSPTPNTLTLTMQVTLSSHNPNSRIGIYYHNLDVYTSYRSQQISLATALPTTYQGHKDFTVWSPSLCGDAVPVSPYVLSSLQQDQSVGAVMVNVKVNGRVKWKVGTWVSGTYHIYVTCPAYIRVAGVVAPAVKFQLQQGCSVDV